ncbi:MAG TPA: ATP-binding protein [Burkholderiaceae bacterium]
MKFPSPLDLLRAAAAWGLAWSLLSWLDGRIDLANQAMLLVLGALCASPWLPIWAALLASMAAALAFNWNFVPPRGSLAIDLHQHALLLAALLGVSWGISLLTAMLRREVAVARASAAEAERLRAFSELLRNADAKEEQGQALLAALGEPARALLLLRDGLPPLADDGAALWLGLAVLTADQRGGLWACVYGGQPFGPGTGRHEELDCWYLPLRGRRASAGALLLHLPPDGPEPQARLQAQALCDLLGQALERQQGERQARRADAAAELQAMRSTLLTAIAHDYRTPLATIMSAASSLQTQDERLSAAQRRRLADTIVEESAGLARFTENTLQLARVDGPGMALTLDWESAEDLVGAVLARARRRHAAAATRLRARVEPDLPLLRCDALLLAQLLENLVDNALKYAPEGGIEILARRSDQHLVLAVRDRGPGVPHALREKVFEVFQRGDSGRRGSGVGLAACRAIARAMGGEMRLRARSHGGASFECWLPIEAAPRAERWAAPEPARIPSGDRPEYPPVEGAT